MDKAASTGHSDRCRIVVDTCCDFSPEVAANLDVDILGFPFIIDGEERTDDIWSSMSPKEFYDRMRAGARVSTSAVSLGRYIEFFTECAKEGTPTVYLCFTSALSSSYNSACQAADAVRAEYPDFELYVVDNALPCATGALLALEAVRQRSAGLTAKQLVDWANEAKTYVHGYFTLESFDALAAGGRIPPAAAQLTAKLDVKPELSYDLAGSLSLIGVNRGRKKALKSILKSFRENYVPDRTMPIAIMTADAEKDGDWLEAAHPQGGGLRRRHDHSQLRGSHHWLARGPRHGGLRVLGQESCRESLAFRPHRAPCARRVGRRCGCKRPQVTAETLAPSI